MLASGPYFESAGAVRPLLHADSPVAACPSTVSACCRVAAALPTVPAHPLAVPGVRGQGVGSLGCGAVPSVGCPPAYPAIAAVPCPAKSAVGGVVVALVAVMAAIGPRAVQTGNPGMGAGIGWCLWGPVGGPVLVLAAEDAIRCQALALGTPFLGLHGPWPPPWLFPA